MAPAHEFNFDGLIGPTHNYSGLSYGNVASDQHRHQIAHPKTAALQGLAKMKQLMELGIGQGVLPPLHRPAIGFLGQLGFRGDRASMIENAHRADPVLLATCYSASNMWTANAATISPSHDSLDGRLHLTVANLASTLHRSIEHEATYANLSAIFKDTDQFVVHPALPSQPGLADEGAANHTRLAPLGFNDGNAGLELFVYGADLLRRHTQAPQKFPARQTRLASESVARQHGLHAENVFFLQQNPKAIDAGVFHNDVISVGNQNVLLCHELAFVDQANVLNRIQAEFERRYDQRLHVIEFSTDELSLLDAVSSYLFNSQLVTRPDNGMTLICPTECQRVVSAKRCTERILAEDNPVDQVLFLDLRQSMNNGGGPACLRLRVLMTDAQRDAVNQNVLLNEARYQQLVEWVDAHYRESLGPDDLLDPALPEEVDRAMAALSEILQMNCA